MRDETNWKPIIVMWLILLGILVAVVVRPEVSRWLEERKAAAKPSAHPTASASAKVMR